MEGVGPSMLPMWCLQPSFGCPCAIETAAPPRRGVMHLKPFGLDFLYSNKFAPNPFAFKIWHPSDKGDLREKWAGLLPTDISASQPLPLPVCFRQLILLIALGNGSLRFVGCFGTWFFSWAGRVRSWWRVLWTTPRRMLHFTSHQQITRKNRPKA